MKKICTWVTVIAMLVGCACVAVPAQRVYASEASPQNQEADTAIQEADSTNQEADEALQAILEDHRVMALVYLGETQILWAEPSFESEEVAKLPSGQTVFVRDVYVDEDGVEWVSVETYYQQQSLVGSIPRFYLACSDEAFLNWEKEYIGESAPDRMLFSEERGVYGDVEQFPTSYKAALQALKEAHPNWIFVKMDTGLDWNTVISNQMKGDRSLIHKSVPAYFRGECYDDGNWYYPTKEALEYYMDPRNGLSESAIFQFELLTYNATYHTEAAVNAFLNNTFMNSGKYAPGTVMSFGRIFQAVGAEKNISPFHMAARVYQEQGDGTSALISGTYPGYEGYYNYFNISASGTTMKEIIESGLTYAKANYWSNAYASILGGSKIIGTNYIGKGQDTVYLQKYNVDRSSPYGLYNHQYMQNIMAPTSEGQVVKRMYQNVGSLNNTFVFKIPVYNNMPAAACPMPTEPAAKNGWYVENGNYYWYENGVKQGAEGRGKEILDMETGIWYWLDAADGGKRAANKDVYLESYAGEWADRPDGTGKWVRYDENGHMVKGEDYRYGGWYRFDELTGAMIKGWYTCEDGSTYYYDRITGQRVSGFATIEGQEYYFDPETGLPADCVWVNVDGAQFWYEDGIRQGTEGRGKEIYDPASDAWYWLDAVDNGKKAVSKDVYQESVSAFPDREDGTGKWVRYDENGHMVKGWDTNENGTYYFEEVTGAMAKGEATIDGTVYYFDVITGILQQEAAPL